MSTNFGGQRVPAAPKVLDHEVNAFWRLFDHGEPAFQKRFKRNSGLEKTVRETAVADSKEILSERLFTFEMPEHRRIGEAGHGSDVPNCHSIDPTAGKEIERSGQNRALRGRVGFRQEEWQRLLSHAVELAFANKPVKHGSAKGRAVVAGGIL